MTTTQSSRYEHPTTAQNRAHRNDVKWIKSKGRSFDANGEHYISEYRNIVTGQTIRKSWKMTGCDWFVFDANNRVVGYGHATLTYAKYSAEGLFD